MKNKDTSTKVSVNSKDFLYENWTMSAYDCYERKGKCLGCILENICSNQPKDNPYNLPPMKYVVLKLLEKHGKPNLENIKVNKGRHWGQQ